MGVVLAVMPWNFPLWQVMRFAAPALMAGNTGLLKHASNVPQTALLLEDVFRRAGFPEGASRPCWSARTPSRPILRDPRVAPPRSPAASRAGRAVGADRRRRAQEDGAGTGRQRPVRGDALGRRGRGRRRGHRPVQNNGQSCIAAKRFIVHTDVFDAFAEKFSPRTWARCGSATRWTETPTSGRWPPSGAATRCTPRSGTRVAARRDVLCGGEPSRPAGWFYPPTVVTDLTPQMRMWPRRSSARSPACTVSSDLDEAIEVANGTTFGLGSNAWTRDEAEQERFAARPGRGRRLHQRDDRVLPGAAVRRRQALRLRPGAVRLGIREFCNTKTVWVGKSDSGETAGGKRVE